MESAHCSNLEFNKTAKGDRRTANQTNIVDIWCSSECGSGFSNVIFCGLAGKVLNKNETTTATNSNKKKKLKLIKTSINERMRKNPM